MTLGTLSGLHFTLFSSINDPLIVISSSLESSSHDKIAVKEN